MKWKWKRGQDQDHLVLYIKENGMVQLYSVHMMEFILYVCIGPVAVKKLNVSNPTEQQLQAFKNEVAVLM